MIKLTVLGSSGGAPTRTNPASGYLVETAATAIWVDCGTGTFMELARHVDPGKLGGVVISHVHADHCSDIFGLYGYLAYGPSGDVPVPVLVPTGAHEHLSAFARATQEHVFNAVLAFTTVSPGEEVELGDAVLRFAAASHPVPTLITRIESDGSSLVYSGDTGPTDELVTLAAHADGLLCEATIEGGRTEQSYPFHLTAAEAGEAAAEAGVDRLFLTHLASTVRPESALAEATSRFTGAVEYAAPGATFEMG